MHIHNGSGSIKCEPLDGIHSGLQYTRGLDQCQDWTTPQHIVRYPSLVENGTITNEVYPGKTVWSTLQTGITISNSHRINHRMVNFFLSWMDEPVLVVVLPPTT